MLAEKPRKPFFEAVKPGQDAPAAAVFEEALLAAKRELQQAHAYSTEGYDGGETLLRTVGTIAQSAEDLYLQMEQRHNPKQKQRVTEN